MKKNRNDLIIILLLASLISTTIYGIYEFYKDERPEMEAYKCENPNCRKIHYRPIADPPKSN